MDELKVTANKATQLLKSFGSVRKALESYLIKDFDSIPAKKTKKKTVKKGIKKSAKA
jgi:hypothetical protein